MQQFQEASGFGGGDEAGEGDHADMMNVMMKYMPLRALVAFSGGGAMTEDMMNQLLEERTTRIMAFVDKRVDPWI